MNLKRFPEISLLATLTSLACLWPSITFASKDLAVLTLANLCSQGLFPDPTPANLRVSKAVLIPPYLNILRPAGLRNIHREVELGAPRNVHMGYPGLIHYFSRHPLTKLFGSLKFTSRIYSTTRVPKLNLRGVNQARFLPGDSLPEHSPSEISEGIVVSAILFLSDPNSYTGGNVTLSTASGPLPVEIQKDTLLILRSTTRYAVSPVTAGELRILNIFYWTGKGDPPYWEEAP